MAQSPIRVLLVDDSPLMLLILKRVLAAAPEIEVIGTAADGREGLAEIERLRPAVVCTDFQMPVMDGLELTRAVMERCPCPILVVSAVVGDDHPERVFALLEAGAVDIFPKPRAALAPGSPEAQKLIRKIKIAAGVFVFARRRADPDSRLAAPGAAGGSRVEGQGSLTGRGFPAPLTLDPRPSTLDPPTTPGSASRLPPRIVAIGASTGGPRTLQTILTRLPAAFPVPVLCVQHISQGFLKGLVEWLAGQCQVKVRIARSGEQPLPGHVYFPEEETHLILDAQGRLAASHDAPVGGHRPAVTVTFQSVAQRHGAAAIAVLLTGMGRDGVDGMEAVARAGGLTIAQDEASCVVFGMPREAIAAGAARQILAPEAITQALLEGAGRAH